MKLIFERCRSLEHESLSARLQPNPFACHMCCLLNFKGTNLSFSHIFLKTGRFNFVCMQSFVRISFGKGEYSHVE